MAYPDLLEKLRATVGAKNVFTGIKKTAYYRSGFRSVIPVALAVVFPEPLLQQWHILQHCVNGGGKAIILQGAKTGLTEGSEVVAAGGKLSRDPEPENYYQHTWQCCGHGAQLLHADTQALSETQESFVSAVSTYPAVDFPSAVYPRQIGSTSASSNIVGHNHRQTVKP